MVRLGLLLTMTMWASQYPLINDLAARWDPLSIGVLRYAMALLVLLVYLRARGQLPVVMQRITHVDWRRLFALGAAMGLFATCLAVGIAVGDPVTTAIVAASSPVIAAFFSWWIMGERPRPVLVLAAAVTIPGAVVASVGVGDFDLGNPKVVGAGLVLVAHALWCWYSIYCQRWLPNTAQSVIVTVTMLPACFVLLGVWALAATLGAVYVDPFSSPAADAVMFLIVGAGAASLGVVLWNRAVTRLGVTEATLYLNFTPVVAMAIAYGFGIVPSVSQLVGAAMVMTGIMLTAVTRRDRRGTKAASTVTNQAGDVGPAKRIGSLHDKPDIAGKPPTGAN